MLSFLKAGDIYGAIRQITNLPGLSFHADGDKIKYALLNHSMAMRANLSGGAPIFNNIRQWEAEIEKRDIACMMSGDLPSMAANAAAAARNSSLFATDNDLRIDNAALAFIMAKELTFLNRAIQMISLMATRYQEEEEDAQWGCSPKCDSYDDDIVSSEEPPSPHSLQPNEDLESATGGDGLRLLRSQSHDYPYTTASASAPASERTQKPTNQLVSTFLIASGRLMTRFIGLCKFTGTDIVLVNAMTTRDSPHSSDANHAKQFRAQSNVVSDIYLHYTKYDAEHRDPVVAAFLELRDISASTWKVMSLFACSNLFRLTAGTDFARYDDPEDAIFTQSRMHVHSLVAPRKPGEILFSCAAAEAEAAAEVAVEAEAEAEAEAVEAAAEAE